MSTPNLKTFPPVAINPAAYRDALARELHDPWRARMVELLAHGTVDYLQFIERDGLEVQRSLLAHIRGCRDQWKKKAADTRGIADKLKAEAAAKTREAADLFAAGRAALTPAANRTRDEAVQRGKLAEELLATLSTTRQQIRTYEAQDERLVAALMHYMAQPRKEATPPAPPVFNIRVEPPKVELEASIAAPVIEIKEVAITNMPARITTTEIERNGAGEIVSSVQVEKDV